MSTIRSLLLVCTLLGAVLAGLAFAQPVATIERPAMGVRFDAPADWNLEVIDADEQEETLAFNPFDGEGLVAVTMGRLTAADLADLDAASELALRDAWAGFESEIPGLRIEAERVRTVAGIDARVIDFVGQDATGSLISLVGGGVGVVLIAIAVPELADRVHAGLETILASFAFLSTGAAEAAGAGNPLTPPTRSSAGGNPLSPPPTTSEGAPGYVAPFTDTDPGTAFGGVLDVGFDGTWAGTLTGAAYRLTNDSDAGSVRYYYRMNFPGEGGPLAQGTIGVTLALAPAGGGLSAAGLLFDFDPSDGTYLAFALTTTGYLVLQRGDAGLEVLVNEDLDSVRSDARNRLELRAAGNSVEVIVNGATAATLNAERPFAGGVGIVAVGTGAFEFQDFAYQRP